MVKNLNPYNSIPLKNHFRKRKKKKKGIWKKERMRYAIYFDKKKKKI